MPTYDYQCDNCGHLFEAFQNMSDDPLKTCPSCSEDALRRLISGGSGIIFKGSGFYVTDSRGKNSAAGGSNGGGSGSETKESGGKSSESKSSSGEGKQSKGSTDAA